MKTLTKSTFFYKTYPPKCCYFASFGILWTHIDIFFWPKIGFQNLNFFPHYKQGYFPLFYKTLRLIANLLSINLVFGIQLLSPKHSEFQKSNSLEAFLIKQGHPSVQYTLPSIQYQGDFTKHLNPHHDFYTLPFYYLGHAISITVSLSSLARLLPLLVNYDPPLNQKGTPLEVKI